MRRRSLLRAAGLATGATLLPRPAHAFVAAHNWDRYDWGTAPGVTDRLYQGSFPDDLVPRWDVVMAPTPSAEVVPNFGMGLVTYVWDEAGQKKTAKSLEQSIEELVAFPLGSLVYIRADWRQVEYVDTMMYGFWGEGHTWPFEVPRHPFPDDAIAEATFLRMFEAQRAAFRRTPLTTNTQPDWSRVGNAELVDRTIRSFNWLRTDTIFIENEQIEALSNRPPWEAAAVEVSISDGSPESLKLDEGVPYSDNVIAHVKDVGGSLDPGYPLPGRIRQARFILPRGLDWKGLGLTAELEVKGVRRPVRWACRQRLEDGGALTLRPTVGLGDVL